MTTSKNTIKPAIRSQAHLQVAQAVARPKPAKELAFPNAQTENMQQK